MTAELIVNSVSVWGIDGMQRALGIKQRLLGGGKMRPVEIPILREVSLHARQGDRIGIVGHNGSGKSSLLKVIAGIYPPRFGEVSVTGHMASIIEMGVGFDGELTGRQNIKLGLLYSRRLTSYTKELEDKIVDFSELGDKINIPLKYYSSGMMARLAFAVTAFQDPDILLLDEVFATGDAHFVDKSRRLMEEKLNRVSIAIIVTHNGAIVEQFCNRLIVMKAGEVLSEDKPDRVGYWMSQQ